MNNGLPQSKNQLAFFHTMISNQHPSNLQNKKKVYTLEEETKTKSLKETIKLNVRSVQIAKENEEAEVKVTANEEGNEVFFDVILPSIFQKEQNSQIIQGPRGKRGPRGEQGPKGERGSDGTGVNILGSYHQYADLLQEHPLGKATDAYLVNKELYLWDDIEKIWQNAGPIVGPQGPRGIQGIEGPEGPRGEDGPQGEKGDRGPSVHFFHSFSSSFILDQNSSSSIILPIDSSIVMPTIFDPLKKDPSYSVLIFPHSMIIDKIYLTIACSELLELDELSIETYVLLPFDKTYRLLDDVHFLIEDMALISSHSFMIEENTSLLLLLRFPNDKAKWSNVPIFVRGSILCHEE